MAVISDITNECIRREIEDYIEQLDERTGLLETYGRISAKMQAIGAALLEGEHTVVDELTAQALAEGRGSGVVPRRVV